MTAETIPDWMIRMFERVDSFDAEGFAAHFASDGYFKFANNPPAEGREGILQFTQGFFDMISGIKHDFGRAYRLDGVEVLEGAVTYVRKDGSEVGPLPFCSVFDMRGSEVAAYRVYIDASSLFAS
ncbi:MAG TPA: nuclear transport factor 2 family protein [Enhygromyxa sp.]|nr:nuclear transport factor 2 family protein [Enhygromyxa sp.]